MRIKLIVVIRMMEAKLRETRRYNRNVNSWIDKEKFIKPFSNSDSCSDQSALTVLIF